MPEPQPRFEVHTDPSVMVPMRDGVQLSTDVYVPVISELRLPSILIRTPFVQPRTAPRVKGLARPFGRTHHGPKTKYVDASRSRVTGGYSPMSSVTLRCYGCPRPPAHFPTNGAV